MKQVNLEQDYKVDKEPSSAKSSNVPASASNKQAQPAASQSGKGDDVTVVLVSKDSESLQKSYLSSKTSTLKPTHVVQDDDYDQYATHANETSVVGEDQLNTTTRVVDMFDSDDEVSVNYGYQLDNSQNTNAPRGQQQPLQTSTKTTPSSKKVIIQDYESDDEHSKG